MSGGEIVDYSGDGSIPVELSPAAGTDLLGECWYLTSMPSNWVYISLFVDGDAVLGWDPDLDGPGPIAYATERIPRCTSEPNPAVDPSAAVWDYVTSYIHPPPAPELSPPEGEGITGLETFAAVSVPELHTATLSAGGTDLEVEIEVGGVGIDWGDGLSDEYPGDEGALSGYPDGIARHVYQAKEPSGYALAVSYHWVVRWRASGGPWLALAVPDTGVTVIYPVAEVMPVITD